MVFFFRTNTFDVSSEKDDDIYCGEDLSVWLSAKLENWETDVLEEDWGWAVEAKKESHHYIFGIYDHDTTDIDENGAIWCIRIFNQRDKTPWYKKLIRYIPPVADPEVVNEIETLLRMQEDFSDIQKVPLE